MLQAAPVAVPPPGGAPKPDAGGSEYTQLAAIKRKNRAAQQRYRQRQRQRQQESISKIADLAQQVEELQLKQVMHGHKAQFDLTIATKRESCWGILCHHTVCTLLGQDWHELAQRQQHLE